MKSITCWDDLRPYGIVMLTGEACGLSYRILCDVTARGKALLEKALGITELVLAENWNHGTEADNADVCMDLPAHRIEGMSLLAVVVA